MFDMVFIFKKFVDMPLFDFFIGCLLIYFLVNIILFFFKRGVYSK